MKRDTSERYWDHISTCTLVLPTNSQSIVDKTGMNQCECVKLILGGGKRLKNE